jgi:ubiquitin carboxyl-terminal hydrolase 7
LYLTVRAVTDDTFRAYSGTDLTIWDLKHESDPSGPRLYRLLRKSTIQELIETIAEDTGNDPKRIRIWCMVNRQNKTVRPDVPITELDISIEEANQKHGGTKTQDLRIWAELLEEPGPGVEPIAPTHNILASGTLAKTDVIALFLKWFDIENQALTGAGHVYISKDKKVEDLVPEILKKMRWPERSESGERQQLKLFEVGSPHLSDPLADHYLGDQACDDRAPEGQIIPQICRTPRW